MAFSAGALYLKLLGQLHPSKPLVDALFQAHRLEWVMAGRYFFTQPMPGGVQFPYAIGLYVVAAPWTVLAHDHVALLRIVVCTAEAIAGALLYPMIVRTWGDRLAGAAATVLFSVVPISAVVIGNANLTNAFGESIALATMAVVVMGSGAESQHRSCRGVVCPGVAGLSLARQHVRDLVGDAAHARGLVCPPDCAGVARCRSGALLATWSRSSSRRSPITAISEMLIEVRFEFVRLPHEPRGSLAIRRAASATGDGRVDLVSARTLSATATHPGVRRLADSAPRDCRRLASASSSRFAIRSALRSSPGASHLSSSWVWR